MKKNFTKKTVLALSLLIIVSLFTTVAFAADGEYVQWKISDDETVVRNVTDDISYRYFWNGTAIFPDSDVEYVYDQDIQYAGTDYLTVIASPDYKDAVWIDDPYGYRNIFATEKGAEDLNAFTNGKTGSFVLVNVDGERAQISKETVEAFDAALRSGEGVKTFDLRDLKPVGQKNEVFELIARDESGTFAYNYGAIYRFSDGKYWYVNFSDLENNCFDSYGDLSYRSGSIEMVPISDVSLLEASLSDMSYRYTEYVYEWEGDTFIDEDTQSVFTILFWIFYVVIVVVPALPLMGLGVLFANLKKFGKPKYWYLLTAFAALWLIFAIALAVVFLIIMI